MARLRPGAPPQVPSLNMNIGGGGSSSSTAPAEPAGPLPQSSQAAPASAESATPKVVVNDHRPPSSRGAPSARSADVQPGTDRRREDAGVPLGGLSEEALNSGASSSTAGAAAETEEPNLAVPAPPEPSAPPNGGYASKAFAPAAAAAASVDRGASAQLQEVQRLREEHERLSSPKGVPEHWKEPPTDDLRLEVQADGDAEQATVADDEAAFFKGGERVLVDLGDAAIEPTPAVANGPREVDKVSPAAPASPAPELHLDTDSLDEVKDGEQGSDPPRSVADAGEERDPDGEVADHQDPPPPPRPRMKQTDTDIDGRFFKPFHAYSRLVMRCPWCCFLMYMVCNIVLVIGLWRPIVLEQDLKTFVRADGQALRSRDAYDGMAEIQSDLNDKFLSRGRRLDAAQDWIFKGFEVLYAPRDGLTALDHRVLAEVRDFENKMRDMPAFEEFCIGRSSDAYPQWACDPGESFAAYVWPTQVPPSNPGERFILKWDRLGKAELGMPAIFSFMADIFDASGDVRGDEWLYFPKTFDRTKYDTDEPMLLRSKFSFSLLYGSTSDPSSVRAAGYQRVTKEYTAFIQDKIYPVLASASRDTRYVDVYYRGSDMDMYEALLGMQSDVFWALGSIAFVTAYMAIHVRSAPFTFGAFFCIFFSVPLAYVCTPAAKTTFASLMSLFLITVIDIDIIFVFNDFWTQSERYGTVDRRLTWTIVRAGRSCMATTITTSLSFFANLLSCLQPLREFGLFMGLCVTNVFVLALMLLPPLIVIRARRERRDRPDLEKEEADAAHAAAVLRALKSCSSSGDEEAAPITGLVRGRAPKAPRATKRKEAKPEDATNTLANIILYRLVDCVAFLPWTILSLTLMCTTAFFVSIAFGIKLDQGVPAIFQEKHNQVLGKAKFDDNYLAAADASAVANPIMNAAVCDAMSFNFSTKLPNRACALTWCDMDKEHKAVPIGEGSCWQGPTMLQTSNTSSQNLGFSMEQCSTVKVRMFSSMPSNTRLLELTELMLADLSFNLTTQAVQNAMNMIGKLQFTSHKPLLMEDWESGDVRRGLPLYEVELFDVAGPASGTSVCEVPVTCYFGPLKCKTPEFRRTGAYNFTARRLSPLSGVEARTDDAQTDFPLAPVAPSRRLPMINSASALVDYKAQIEIQVVYGVTVPTTAPVVGAQKESWRWDRFFEPDNPWAQRAMAAMCDEKGLPEELLVTEKTCWIETFRQALTKVGKRFPSRTFDDDLVAWYLKEQALASKNLWVVDGKLKGSRFVFRGDYSKKAGAENILKYKALWDNYIAAKNSEATLTANDAWHTSETWVLAEAQHAIIASTTETIVTECALGFFGILFFTGDLISACLILLLMVFNLGGMTCFMVQVMGWAIGPIEIIFLVVFLGYSITFGLHFVANFCQVSADDSYMLFVERWVRKRKKHLEKRMQKWESPNTTPRSNSSGARGLARFRPSSAGKRNASGDSLVVLNPGREVRKARVRMAMLRVGGAVFSTTLSTIGSSVFLLFCTLNFFIRLGNVIIAVTVLSLFSTLVVLPALLIVFGPSSDPCYKRLPARAFRWLLGRIRPERPKRALDADPLLE